jgi:iron complex transport system ATP-binding protein
MVDNKKHASATPLLEVEKVSFGYGQQIILYDVSLSLNAGTMAALLGPNGSGKTTLLRLLSGVTRPQQGQILLEGRDVQHWGRRALARRIAVVPQEVHMPFAFTVEQMVEMGRTPFVRSFWGTRNSDDHEQVQEAMRACGVSWLAGRIFNELSGGEQQRVLIAMALAQQPSLLLLDEPTSHLDIKYQVETLELIQRLNREHGVTVVAAIHDLNLAARYFSRLLLFQRGIVADGGPAEVLVPDLLSRVYGISVQVGILRGASHLSVLPPASDLAREDAASSTRARVHVIAGGGSGELLMRALADAHIPFSAGALNVGDSDHTLALRLAEHVITEQPFSPISSEALGEVHALLEHAALLVLCPTAIGPGNRGMIEEAVLAAQRGLRVVVLDEPVSKQSSLFEERDEDAQAYLARVTMRDYTGGEGVKLMARLLEAGATVAGSVGEVVEVAKTVGCSA